MEDDFDLEGLSAQEAREYVTRFITTQKQVARDRAAAENDVALWKKRVRLAMDRGETELARKSLSRAEEAHGRLVRLRREERDLNFKVEELKRRLTNVERQPEFTVNTGALLEQLEGIVGDHETSEALSDAAAEVALEELKRKMEAENGE